MKSEWVTKTLLNKICRGGGGGACISAPLGRIRVNAFYLELYIKMSTFANIYQSTTDTQNSFFLQNVGVRGPS